MMENIITRLFVYGTLRSGFRHPAYEYISKYFNLLGEAMVRGILYDLGEYPAALPIDKELFVRGELYELKKAADFEWAFGQLDDYEGLNPEEGERALFRRELANIVYNHQHTQAWIYWYNQEVTERPLVGAGNIFDYMTYKSNG